MWFASRNHPMALDAAERAPSTASFAGINTPFAPNPLCARKRTSLGATRNCQREKTTATQSRADRVACFALSPLPPAGCARRKSALRQLASELSAAAEPVRTKPKQQADSTMIANADPKTGSRRTAPSVMRRCQYPLDRLCQNQCPMRGSGGDKNNPAAMLRPRPQEACSVPPFRPLLPSSQYQARAQWSRLRR
jgi:hypothetical protein